MEKKIKIDYPAGQFIPNESYCVVILTFSHCRLVVSVPRQPVLWLQILKKNTVRKKQTVIQCTSTVAFSDRIKSDTGGFIFKGYTFFPGSFGSSQLTRYVLYKNLSFYLIFTQMTSGYRCYITFYRIIPRLFYLKLTHLIRAKYTTNSPSCLQFL